jgi:hypothetical protein
MKDPITTKLTQLKYIILLMKQGILNQALTTAASVEFSDAQYL